MKDEPGLSSDTDEPDIDADGELRATEPADPPRSTTSAPATSTPATSTTPPPFAAMPSTATPPAADNLDMPGSTAGKAPLKARGPLRLGRLLLRFIVLIIGCSIILTVIYRLVPPPVTPLMLLRLVDGNGLHKDWVSYEDISPNLPRAVIAAEDSGFCQHNGFDWTAIEKAWQRNQHSPRLRGGSTISNQTAKNVFLWPDRTYIRKAVEFYFTALIEFFWSKKRILEIYLNMVEWGPGIYGAEAAAQAHFHKPAKALTRREAALLAAVLPNPRRWSASKPTAYIRGRASTIQARMGDIPDPTGDPCKP